MNNSILSPNVKKVKRFCKKVLTLGEQSDNIMMFTVSDRKEEPKMDAVSIGQKLKKARIEKGETLEHVSDCCDISKSALAMYETGKRTPRDSVQIALAKH